MPASSNFQQAIRDAQSSALVGPNVVNKALPYVGGGMVLTSVGVIGGLSMMATPMFMPLFWGYGCWRKFSQSQYRWLFAFCLNFRV